jgi:hypothetical protein
MVNSNFIPYKLRHKGVLCAGGRMATAPGEEMALALYPPTDVYGSAAASAVAPLPPMLPASASSVNPRTEAGEDGEHVAIPVADAAAYATAFPTPAGGVTSTPSQSQLLTREQLDEAWLTPPSAYTRGLTAQVCISTPNMNRQFYFRVFV